MTQDEIRKEFERLLREQEEKERKEPDVRALFIQALQEQQRPQRQTVPTTQPAGGSVRTPAVSTQLAQPAISPEPGFLNKFANFLVGETGIEFAQGLERLGRRFGSPGAPVSEVFRGMPERLQRPPTSTAGAVGRGLAGLITFGGSEPPFTEAELGHPLIQGVAAIPPGTPIAPLAGPLARMALASRGIGVTPPVARVGLDEAVRGITQRPGVARGLVTEAPPAPKVSVKLPDERVVPPTTAEGQLRYSFPESVPRITTLEFKMPRVVRDLQTRLLNRERDVHLNAAQLTSLRGFLNKYGASPFETSVGREPALGRFVVSPSTGERVFILGAFDDYVGSRFYITFNPEIRAFGMDAQVCLLYTSDAADE